MSKNTPMKKVNKQALLEVDEEVLSQFRREQVKFKNGEEQVKNNLK